MAVQYPLAVVLGLIDKLTGPFGKSIRSLGGASKVLRDVGKTLTTHVTLPMVALGTAAVVTGAAFGGQLNRVQAASGATGEEMAVAREQVLAIGKETQAGARSAADALHALVDEGESLTEGLGNLTPALQFANVAQMDVAASARLLDDLLDAYGDSAGGAAQALDLVIRGSRVAGDEAAGFGQALIAVGPTARALNVPLGEVVKQLAALAARGFSADSAAAGLKASYIGLAKLGAAAADGTLDVGKALERFAEAGVGAEDLIRKFGRSAGPTLGALLDVGKAGLDEYGSKLDDVRSLGEQHQIVNQGITGAVKDLSAAWSDLLIKASEGGLLGALTSLLRVATPLLDKIGQASPATMKWGLALGAAAAAIGPLAVVLGALLSPIGLIAAGVAALGLGAWWLYDNWKAVTEGLGNFFSKIGRWLADLLPEWAQDLLGIGGEPISVGTAAGAPIATGAPLLTTEIYERLSTMRNESTVEIQLRGFPAGTRVRTEGEAQVTSDLGMAMLGAGG